MGKGINKAKAVKPRQGEEQKIIDAKKVEFLHFQKNYRKMILRKFAEHAELAFMAEQIENYDKLKPGEIMEWQGISCPKPILVAHYNFKLDNYRDLLTEINQTKAHLEQQGLTEEQLTKIVEGIHVKEVPEVDKKKQEEDKKSSEYIG